MTFEVTVSEDLIGTSVHNAIIDHVARLVQTRQHKDSIERVFYSETQKRTIKYIEELIGNNDWIREQVRSLVLKKLQRRIDRLWAQNEDAIDAALLAIQSETRKQKEGRDEQ